MSTAKNETPAKEGRDTGKGSAPAATSYRARMSLEKKLGIAFIAALLTVFLVVLGVRLMNLNSEDERVDITLSNEAEASPPVAHPKPQVVAESSTAPLTAFPNSPAPQVKTPPTATMPPAPAAAPPRYAATPTTFPAAATSAPMTPTTTTPPAAPASFATSSGNRYSNAMTSPSTMPTASPPAFGVATSTDAAITTGGNPLRSAGPPPTTVSSPAAGAPYTGANTGYAAVPSSPPTNNYVPTAANLPPRTPGVASLGASTTVGASSDMATSTMAPAVSMNATATAPRTIAASTAASAAPPSVISAPAAAPLVAAPAAMPLAVSPSAPQAKPYVVAPGDSFWSIAQQAYGDGAYYRALFAYNSDRYPHAEDVRTGSVLDVPSVEVLKAKYPELCTGGAATVAAGGASPAMTGRANVAVAGRTYTVQDGDTLFDIARQQLGKASYWSEIYNLNRGVLGENLEQLKPGTELMLPAVQQ